MKCPEIDVDQLEKWFLESKEFQLLDVREPQEYSICRFEQTTHEIPMGQLQKAFTELQEDKTTVIYCRSGHRSLYATHALYAEGFNNVFNLKGGILAYIQRFKKNWTTY